MSNGVFTAAAIALGMLAWLSFYRVAVGPSAADRIVAMNVIGTKTLVILILVGFARQETVVFIDAALIYALISFLATVGIGQYYFKGRLL